jgi:hypothetical protein
VRSLPSPQMSRISEEKWAQPMRCQGNFRLTFSAISLVG